MQNITLPHWYLRSSKQLGAKMAPENHSELICMLAAGDWRMPVSCWEGVSVRPEQGLIWQNGDAPHLQACCD